jgi:formate hydrogenlyase transcriptional activator
MDEPTENTQDLAAIIDNIPCLAWTCRPDGRSEFTNRRWRDYTGLSMEQSLGCGWEAPIHPDDLPKLRERWFGMLDSGETGECEARLRRFDGEYRWILWRAVPVRDDTGDIVRWYGTNTDIEDLKRAEEKLQQDERELRQIVDLIPQFIVVFEPGGKTLYVNRTTLKYFGSVDRNDLLSSYAALSGLTDPDEFERLRTQREEGLARGVPFDLEVLIRCNDGAVRCFLVCYNPLLDEQGRVLRWYATATDIDDRAQAEKRMRNENLALREQIDRESMFEEIVGSSEALHKVLHQVTRVAPLDCTVLILGETGTGKELIARAIHKRSNRATSAFIAMNCAAIPAPLIASELFGYEKGAFTGATQRRMGRFEAANGGTIFLDEIGDLPPETQIALLRVLQERKFERVGSNEPISSDVRVLAATHRDLSAAVSAGTFRQDLFYRLNVFPIQMPALRERVEDIPLLVEYFIDHYGKNAGKKFRKINSETLELLQAYDWPGNIRELQNVVERAVVLSDDDTFYVDEAWLKWEAPQVSRPTALFPTMLRQEKEMIENALAASGGRVSGPSGAAIKLGIPKQTLESKIKRLQIDKNQFKISRAS